MPLSPGTRLGPYEIVAPLGAGGMGEVYRAKDSRLGREVAVKVLPQHLSANPEVRTRFEREAKTVSSLNHPNICTLFDVGREGDTDYLVMELIEGETLAQRLTKGALPTAEVLRLGAQISDALDRAHRAGVIHRDLKPGNVMLTKSGAKLMDFGLARATGMAGPASGSGITQAALTQSPTVAQALTAEGTIVGTFQYMPPEQLEGGEADARSDLWALGCVLYEMSTGRRAFEGRSQASLISAIMSSEPAAVSQVAPMSPPSLDRLIAACLAKDPADRVQSAHDVRLQLQWMSEPGSQSASALPGAATTLRARSTALLTRVSLAVGVLGLVAAVYMGYAQSSRKSPVMRLQIPMPSDLALAPFWSFSALSPDGAHVVATGNRGKDGQKLWLWALASSSPIEMAGAANGYSPTWSPDGRALAYFSTSGGLFRLPLAGGNPTKLCAAPDARGASWGRKGMLVFAPSASGPLHQVAAGGGASSPVTALDSTRGESAHRFPCFLPDGEHFLFATLPEGPRGFPIFVGSLGSKQVKHIMDAGCAPIYAEPGYLVFVQGGNVTAQRFDTNRLALVGEPVAIGDAPAMSEFTAEPVATASRNDRLLIQRLTSPRSRLEWFDRRGSSLSTVALPEGDWRVRALSPDQTFAIATRDRDIWRIDLERAVATRIVRDAWDQVGVALSPDGRRLAVDLGKSGGLSVDIFNAGGSGAAERLKTTPALFQDVADWSPDGASLLLAVLGQKANQGGDTSWDLWTVPVTDSGTPAPYVSTSAVERYARISPDGKWALFMTADGGQLEIFVDSYPVPGHRLQVLSGEPDRECRILWGRDSREVLYSDRHGDLISLALEPVGDDLRAGKPTRLFALPEGMTGIRTRDGERFLVSRTSGSTPGPSMQLTLGWTGLLRK